MEKMNGPGVDKGAQSAIALSRYSSSLKMRIISHYQFSDWLLGEMILLAES
jgi:hypothetical protein